jgi:hypothetical protein
MPYLYLLEAPYGTTTSLRADRAGQFCRGHSRTPCEMSAAVATRNAMIGSFQSARPSCSWVLGRRFSSMTRAIRLRPSGKERPSPHSNALARVELTAGELFISRHFVDHARDLLSRDGMGSLRVLQSGSKLKPEVLGAHSVLGPLPPSL